MGSSGDDRPFFTIEEQSYRAVELFANVPALARVAAGGHEAFTMAGEPGLTFRVVRT